MGHEKHAICECYFYTFYDVTILEINTNQGCSSDFLPVGPIGIVVQICIFPGNIYTVPTTKIHPSMCLAKKILCNK